MEHSAWELNWKECGYIGILIRRPLQPTEMTLQARPSKHFVKRLTFVINEPQEKSLPPFASGRGVLRESLQIQRTYQGRSLRRLRSTARGIEDTGSSYKSESEDVDSHREWHEVHQDHCRRAFENRVLERRVSCSGLLVMLLAHHQRGL